MNFIYQIIGADSKSGADRTISVRASDESEAVKAAKRIGVHPYKVSKDERATDEAISVERAKEQSIASERYIHDRVKQIKEEMRDRLSNGNRVYLYDTVYIPVDSILLDEPLSIGFDIPELRRLGLLGWEVVQVVPKTVGVGITNSEHGHPNRPQSWGGGIGGNVTGVHVILKMELMMAALDDSADDELACYIRGNLESFNGV